ncbi:Type II secretion inner membrane protein (PulF) [plant metagenome]|uniref:Type II secretion inner membrane protein (PulF) n=1 Tax=plant metagenome TaxID=1297885 RepID=A0A484UHE5_9ZZZZ
MLSELAEPVLLVALSVNLLNQISQKIVPIMSRSHDLSQSTGNTYIMYWLATGVQDYGIYVLSLAILFVFWVLWSLPRRGDTQFRMVLEHFPPWSVYKAIQGATFLLNVAIMLRSGIPLYRALELMQQFSSPWLKERVETTMFGLRQGRSLGVALANTEYDFPDKDVLPFIIVLSQQKDYEQAINTLALKWIDRTLKKVKSILSTVRLFLYVSIAYLAYVLFAGMTSLSSL